MDDSRKKINDVYNNGKSFKPKRFGKGGMDEKGEAGLNNVANFPLGNTISLRSVGTRDAIRDPMGVVLFSKSILDEFWFTITLKSFGSSREKIFSVGFLVVI